MIKKIFAFLFIMLSITANSEVGDWTLYPSYHNSTYCQIAGDKIYILASGALYKYDKEDNEIYLYDKINTLSDIDITHIVYSDEIDALIIVYSNANIDILYNNDEIYNLSDFKNKNLPNKTINGINIQGTKAFLSTSFGVVEINIENLEFTNTYTTGLNTYCTYLYNNNLYCGTSEGVFRCDINKNILDKSNWEKVNNYSTEALCELNGELYCLIKNLGIYTLNDNKILTLITGNKGEKYHTIYSNGNEIIAPATNKTTIINSNKESITYKNSNSSYIIKDREYFWDCKGYKGFVKCEVNGNSIEECSTPIIPNSPIRNYCEFMKFSSSDKLLVAGGNINYFDIVFHDGTIMEFNYNDKEWNNYPEEIIKTTTGLQYRNICSVDEDPTEPGHYFASSFGYGIYEFRDGQFIKHYTIDNSNLETVVPNSKKYVRVPMVKFDGEGNLWCINTGVKNIIKILKKDGTWTELEYKLTEYLPTMVEPVFDSRGWLWVTSMQNETGLFCAKTNNTLFDTSDDETKIWLNKFTNQDGISYDIHQLYTLAEDKKGSMWVGTNTGLFVIDNPEEFFESGIFKQIKVPRNDGTGLADYLLNGTNIKVIRVDGANRKWIGTNDNGLYLISADGLETIHHFTTENSPLPSDNIWSIAINEISGEVFIGTDKGIASYKSDATRPESKLDKNKIHAYPNPVRAEYNGIISIVGLTADCNVKIVDSAGLLINEGTSNGGQYTWNGRNKRGEKVASGVYYVLTYDNTGEEGVATKILITK